MITSECPTNNINNTCFSRVDGNGLTHRGCLINLNEDIRGLCVNGTTNCLICSTDGCNNAVNNLKKKRNIEICSTNIAVIIFYS